MVTVFFIFAIVDINFIPSTFDTRRYVRCLKPNNSKSPSAYDDELLVTQLRYSGMLDIVRIRREGYPVHVPAKEFLSKYRCLADNDKDPLPANEKLATAKILKSLHVPDTEWQLGKTKVFLRLSVFDPLEEKRKLLITKKMVVIQKVWRGWVARRAFLRQKAASIVIQKHFRGNRLRVRYIRRRRAVIVIQAHYRGWIARELAAELRKKKAKELAEKRRLQKLEEERIAKLNAEKTMEESYRAAQMELLTLAKIAEHKSKRAVNKTGDVDLDKMFEFLSEGPKAVGREEKDFLASITSDLEQMFQKSEKEERLIEASRKKPVRPAPQPPRSSSTPVPTTTAAKDQAKLSRIQRRQRRVMKKLLGDEDEFNKKDEPFDPNLFPMLKFAEMYFNDFPKDTGGFSTLSLRRAPRVKDPVPKSEMLSFNKSTNIPTSIVHMHDPENVNLACGIYKDLCKLLKGDLKSDQYNLTMQSTIAYGIERPELRDEIFCQLIRQVTDNPSEEAVMRGWHFLTLCTIAFPPSKNFNKVST